MGQSTVPTPRSLPRRLWAHYWRYVTLSGLLFALGIALGALAEGSVGPGALSAGQGTGAALPEPTVGLLTVNNAVVTVLLVASGLTLGLGTAGILLYNGLVVGYVVAVVARAEGLAVVAVGLLPHGVVEIPAFLLASAVAFRFSHQVLGAATGRRQAVMTGPELREAVVLAALALGLIPVAAYIEANVTTALLESRLPGANVSLRG